MPFSLRYKNTWELHLTLQNDLNQLQILELESNCPLISKDVINVVSELLQECVTYQDTNRYIFLKWIKTWIKSL